jgi:NADH-quinone oxidoreductase subunit L
MTRQVWMVFYDGERWREPEPVETPAEAHQGDEPHDAPWTMTVPLLALAGLSIVGGFINLPFTDPPLEFLTEWLHPVFEDVPEIHAPSFSSGFVLSTVALVIAVVGIVVGRALYKQGLEADGADPLDRRLGPVATVLANAYYLDTGLARFVSGPVTAFANFLARFDRRVIDGSVNGIATGFREFGNGLRRVQTGVVRNYALGIVLGAVVLMIWFATRVTL